MNRRIEWSALIFAILLLCFAIANAFAEEDKKEPIPSKDLVRHQQENFGKPGKYSTKDGNGYFEIETKYESEDENRALFGEEK